MSKATVNMTNWELYIYDNHYNLSGTADNHPTLGKNVYISHTSSLVDYTFADDVLIYETRNTVYMCPLKYMSTWPYTNVEVEYREELTHKADTSESILDTIIAATAKLSILETQKRYENHEIEPDNFYKDICKIKADYSDDKFMHHIIDLQTQGQKEIIELEQKENERLISIARNYEDCIYIEVSNVENGSLLAYHLGDYTGIVQPYLHVGMFQDSVLYTKYESEDNTCSLDFRYFPMGFINGIMKTYCWSDNIAKAVIKNDTNYPLTFNEVEIQVGETKVFTSDKDKHEQENN